VFVLPGAALGMRADITSGADVGVDVIQAPASGIKVMGTDATTDLVMSGGDWFSTEVNAHVTSRSYRFGFIDYGRVGGDGAIVRPPQTVVQMMAVWQNHGKRG
jgi:hypothetical protein